MGWDVKIINGHSHEEIIDVLSDNTSTKPKAIIANTIKGYGIKTMENNPAWHHRTPSDSEFDSMIKELS
jgi:transketolase